MEMRLLFLLYILLTEQTGPQACIQEKKGMKLIDRYILKSHVGPFSLPSLPLFSS